MRFSKLEKRLFRLEKKKEKENIGKKTGLAIRLVTKVASGRKHKAKNEWRTGGRLGGTFTS